MNPREESVPSHAESARDQQYDKTLRRRFYTNSEMSTWRRCKRKWWLQEYRGLQKVGRSEWNRPLGIGNRVHECLAVYYTPDDPTDPLQFLAETLTRDLAIAPEHEDAIQKEVNLCQIMLEGYMDWLSETGEDQAITVIEAEQARVARLEPGRDAFLLSKLDARVRHDAYGTRVALEHKSVTSLDQHLPELRLNSQVLTEHLVEYMALLEEGADPEPAQGVLFNMLKKVKRTTRANPPFYSRTFVRHSTTELRNHWRHVIAITNEIEDATRRLDSGESHQFVVHPSPTADCHWSCPWFRCCPMFDSGEDVEGYLASHFEEGNPLERYDGLIELGSETS